MSKFLNKEIVVKTNVKKELLKRVVLSFIFSYGVSHILILSVNFGIQIGRANETLEEFPIKGLLYLIPMFAIIFMLFYTGEMVIRGDFHKGGKKK